MNRLHLQRIIEELRHSFRCPECGEAYNVEAIHFRGHLGNLYFVQLNCPGHLPMMALARVINERKRFRIEKSLQLTAEDASQFAADIKQWRGSFNKLWSDVTKA